MMNVFLELKSVTSLRPCIIMRFLFFLITIIIYMKGVVTLDTRKEIIEDLPTAENFDEYLTSLEKIVDFCMRHKVYVDMNLEFGLFLTSVNLKAILHEKRHKITKEARFRLEYLLLDNDELANFYHLMVQINKNRKEYKQDRKISTLFYNESSWPKRLDKFNIDLLKQTPLYTPAQLKEIYGEWVNYERNVFDYDRFKPSPNESDGCIKDLAKNQPSFHKRTRRHCRTSYDCKQGVKTGHKFGYFLSHRILFMIIARYARGCTVFSENEDKYKVDKFCIRSFQEAQYIASNNFQLLDLLMEQMVFCGLFGHAQFFRKSWISKLLEAQTLEGCFKEPYLSFDGDMQEGAKDKWVISNKNQTMMGGKCHEHLTAVGAGVLASSLRFIMENYY